MAVVDGGVRPPARAEDAGGRGLRQVADGGELEVVEMDGYFTQASVIDRESRGPSLVSILSIIKIKKYYWEKKSRNRNKVS